MRCDTNECCTEDEQCGTRMRLPDFTPCLAAGDMAATLDDTCPAYECTSRSTGCMFSGCRTTTGECGVWVDRYSIQSTEEGFSFTVNLGCVVFTWDEGVRQQL